MDFTELYRKTEIHNIGSVEFGSTTDVIDINVDSYDYISNFVLYINLPVLTSKTTPLDGYINWVDSIGHALIEGIEFKVGNETILDIGMPYGNWLDIYNELTDATFKEWSMIGKNSSIESLKKYANNQRIYHVPLHLPFTTSDYNLGLNNLLPLYLLDSSSNFKIRIKLRAAAGLLLVDGTGNSVAGTTDNLGNLTAKLYYDTYRYTDSQLREKKKSQYAESGYISYYDVMEFQKKTYSSDDISFSRFKRSTIKDLIFVFQHKNRSSIDSTPVINDPNIITDINGNDWFNYTSDQSDATYKIEDPFLSINQLSINNEDEVDERFDSLYFRNVLPATYYINKPNKHIYTYPMKTSRFSKRGLIYIDNYDIKFNFTNNMETSSNFNMLVFATTVKKVEIKGNKKLTLVDIDLEEEQAKLNELAASGEPAPIVGAVSTEISEQAIEKIKESLKETLKKELIDILSKEATEKPDEPAYERGATEKEEVTVENGIRFIKKSFPSPLRLSYKLNIGIIFEGNLYLVFNNDSHLNRMVSGSEEDKKNKLNTLLKNLESFFRNEIEPDIIDEMFESINTLAKPSNFQNLLLIKKIKESDNINKILGFGDNKEQDITIPNTRDIPTKQNITDLKNNLISEVTNIYKTEIQQLFENKSIDEKNINELLDKVIDNNITTEEPRIRINRAMKIKEYIRNIDNLKTLIDKIIKFNIEKGRTYSRVKKYEKKQFIKSGDDYLKINSISKVDLDLSRNLEVYFDSILSSPNNMQRYNIISTILYNLFNSEFNQVISESGVPIDTSTIRESILNFINSNKYNLTVLKVDINNLSENSINNKLLESELQKAFDSESDTNTRNLEIVSKYPKYALNVTDGLRIGIRGDENVMFGEVSLESHKKYAFMDLKKVKLNNLAKLYNSNIGDKQTILNMMRTINTYNRSQLFSKSLFYSPNSSEKMYVLLKINLSNNVKTRENLTLLDINNRINGFIEQFYTLEYQDNYTDETDYEGTILITVT